MIPYFEKNNVTLYSGDVRLILPTMPEKSVDCCVTSPPYFRLRDYGVDGQIGLEQTPEQYVAQIVGVFREVRRVLRDDGTLWLNLGTSYAGSGKGGGGSFQADGMRVSAGGSCGKRPNQPPVDALPYGTDGKELPNSQVADPVCSDSCDERQAATSSHHAGIARNAQSEPQAGGIPSPTVHDSEHLGSASSLLSALLPGAQLSTTPQSCARPPGDSSPSATDGAFPKAQPTLLGDDERCENNSACTAGTSLMLPSLVIRTMGKESFYSACGDSACKGVGKCGLCWCRLAIPSLNIKPKDEINIPHLVAMALQADGWYLRQTIIWHKPATRPESIKDRCTKAHEYIFLLSKSKRYYYDADAIAEDGAGGYVDKVPGGWASEGEKHDAVSHQTPEKHRKVNGGASFGKQCKDASGTMAQSRTFERPTYEKRNKRSVWTVASVPCKEAHFATFPPKLIEPCIKASVPAGGVCLDPFFGSGTTGLVCQQQHVRCIGVELNEAYCAIAAKRLAQGVLFGGEQ